MGQREHGLTARQISRARMARRRDQGGRAVRLEDSQAELVDGFLVGMREVLGDFLDPEDRLCSQQVHHGREEACRSTLADMGFNC